MRWPTDVDGGGGADQTNVDGGGGAGQTDVVSRGSGGHGARTPTGREARERDARSSRGSGEPYARNFEIEPWLTPPCFLKIGLEGGGQP